MTALIAATILSLATLMPVRHVPDRPPHAVTTRIAASPSGTGRHGVASWFAAPTGTAAAGPALRAMLGSHWRGQRVTVTAGGRSVVVLLDDWCACPRRIIDLSRGSFARLADPSRGLVQVTVR